VDHEPIPRPHLDHDRLSTLAPDWVLTVVDSSPSTHRTLIAAAREGEAAAGAVLIAEHQTAGRGRLDRTWTTPARAAVTMSALVAPALPDEDWPWLPLLLGTSVVDGITQAGGPRCGLKWPNDVLHDDLKLGGLLAERVAATAPGAPALAVLSLGLNVTTRRDELPIPTATSLLAAGWEDPDRTTLLLAVLAALQERLESWPAGGDSAERLRKEYVETCTTLGREVRVERPSAIPLVGRAVGVDRDGSLVVATGTGRTRVNAGDVVHVRSI